MGNDQYYAEHFHISFAFVHVVKREGSISDKPKSRFSMVSLGFFPSPRFFPDFSKVFPPAFSQGDADNTVVNAASIYELPECLLDCGEVPVDLTEAGGAWVFPTTFWVFTQGYMGKKLDISVILGIHFINILWTHMEINGWVNSKVSVAWYL
jgi:hypothetical protein